jgi:hypothetical protein
MSPSRPPSAPHAVLAELLVCIRLAQAVAAGLDESEFDAFLERATTPA